MKLNKEILLEIINQYNNNYIEIYIYKHMEKYIYRDKRDIR